MSSSEAMTSMANREPFSMSSPTPTMNPAASQPQLNQQMHMSFMNSDGGGAFRPVSPPAPFQSVPSGAAVISQSAAEQKRKRGRPRKYGPDGSMNLPLGLPQQPNAQQNLSPPPAGAVVPHSAHMESLPPIDGSGSPTAKKARGRPRGSRNKAKQHPEVLGSTGIGFVPHILNVNAGEDISSKIMAICQNGPRAVCVLSANGTVSMVTLRQQATSGGTATFEGRFDILSLSGSFMLTEVAGQKSRIGGLSVTLAQPDGSIMGGCVAGLLVAASPAQVIVGSFLPDGQRDVSKNYVEPSSAPRLNQGGGAGASSSPSRGTLSESSGGPASPLNLSSGAYNMTQGMSGIPWK
ncbi:AT-hook motif nuclear-localized protein 10-like isoform X1 [Salvia splendens]|nr:AT-hook motif nuclear-localized protein 10-like isoform X1 [Salvia splendens]XP_042015135.1 AT-hook motif nuclear-localized protein 10-like isoform X1 [Salvia splendens]XP_042015136.1 AT-hook motif nuclear-localized protein 10-like isoform X1 [Salvia splendens]